jgi:hypothetical protein
MWYICCSELLKLTSKLPAALSSQEPSRIIDYLLEVFTADDRAPLPQ